MTGVASEWRRRDLIALGALLCVTAVLLLFVGRDQWLIADEWSFLTFRSVWPPSELLRPSNEHLHALPILLYRILVNAFGAESYLPYYAVLVAVHVLVVGLTYRLLRVSGASTASAFALCSVIAFLGTAAETLLWAVQIALVGSLAVFLAAMLVALRDESRRADIILNVMLVVGLLTGGAGVAAVAGIAALRWLQRRSVRAALRVLLVPALLYVAWFLAFGRTAVNETHDFADSALLAPQFVLRGLAAAAGAFIGIPNATLGFVVLSVAVIVTAVAVARRRTLPAVTVAAGAMVLALYGSVALLRASHLGTEYAGAQRYVYFGVVLLVVGMGAIFGLLDEQQRRRAGRVVVVIAMVGVSGNLAALLREAEAQGTAEQAHRRRVLAAAALLRDGDFPVLDQERARSDVMPGLRVEGVQSLLAQGAIQGRPAAVGEEAHAAAAATLQLSVGTEDLGASRLAATITEVNDAVAIDGSEPCLALLTTGPDPYVVVSHTAPGSLSLTSTSAGLLQVFGGEVASFHPAGYVATEMSPGVEHVVETAVGGGFLRLDFPPGGVEICGAGRPRAPS